MRSADTSHLVGASRASVTVASTATLKRRRWAGSAVAYTVTGVLIFWIVAPLLVTVWGSFTTLTVMGTASEKGAGWTAPGGSAADAAPARRAAVRQEDLGVFAEGARRTEGWFTTLWFRYVFAVYGRTMLFSLQLGMIAIVVAIVVGVPGGYALVRYRFPGRHLFEELVLIPLSLPGIAVAVAVLETYAIIRAEWYLVLIGHLLYTVPYMVQSVTGTLRSFDFVDLEMAAASLGASWWQRMCWIVLPNLRHAVVVASLLVFAISLGEFNVSFLLNTPVNQTYPAALYDTFANDSFQVACAATVIFMAVVIPVLMVLQMVGGREMQEAGQAA
jgi:putative spermidine/putrescine transport system permease protein